VSNMKYTVTAMLRSTVESVMQFVKILDTVMMRQRDIASTIRELDRLTDQELNDIGVSRHDIRSVAEGTWTRKYLEWM